MASGDNRFEGSLKALLAVTETSGNLRRDLRQSIIEAVSVLREVYNEVMVKNEESSNIIRNLENQLNNARENRQEAAVNSNTRMFSHVVANKPRAEQNQKSFKVFVKSKGNHKHSTDHMKTLIKTKINPSEMKVGINRFKALRNGQILIESENKKETEEICNKINEMCGSELEANTPKLRNPRMVIFNVPEEICMENAHEIIAGQNTELGIENGDLVPKFIFKDRKKANNLVIEVNSTTRKKLVGKKLKIGWNMCRSEDYLRVYRCFKCNKYNHRAQDCTGEVCCPLCAEKHTLQECQVSREQYKCINCINYNSKST